VKKEIILSLSKTFEESAYEQDGVEYWLARDLQLLLEYSEWRNFALVIDKAKISCKNAGQNVADHFVDINKMVGLGSGACGGMDQRPVFCTRHRNDSVRCEKAA
jgi:DNA-damage-inducible protein D